MRINVYAEELLEIGEGDLPRVEVVSKVVNTGRTYFGVRSPSELHAQLRGRRTRSAITIWGPRDKVATLLRDKVATLLREMACAMDGARK